ncbi:hypothetical protein BJ741DRAFT_607450 [Chytriomyces cf. hyalinus JEL632]|nr:hypothetical protein BJ741DRAFT_607450 [Chytriomyces cf. hyalinus JEL632]
MGIKSLRDRVKQVEERAQKASVAIDNRIQVFRRKIRQPREIQRMEKVIFLLGVSFMLLVQHLLVSAPQHLIVLYCWSLLPLMFIRYVEFHRVKWHYFLLDFCYYVNAFLFYYLSRDSSNSTLFNIVFVWSNGPLMWAIVMWRTSLVFHSLSHITSAYIHLLPALVTYVIRWYPNNEQAASLCVWKDCALAWGDVFYWPLCLYLVWQVLYLMKTEWIDAPKLQSDPELSTSFRFLSKSYAGTPLGKIVYIFGDRFAIVMFVLMQFIYTGIVFVPTYWLYQNQYAHATFIIFITGTSIYNGAGYYIFKMSKSPDYFKDYFIEDPSNKRESEIWFKRYIRRGPAAHANTTTGDNSSPNAGSQSASPGGSSSSSSLGPGAGVSGCVNHAGAGKRRFSRAGRTPSMSRNADKWISEVARDASERKEGKKED